MFKNAGFDRRAASSGVRRNAGRRPKVADGEWWKVVALAPPFAMVISIAAHADTRAVFPSGLPVQVKPTFQEPYAPQFSFPAGGQTGSGGNSGSPDSGGGGGGGGGGGYSGCSGCDPFATMMSQSWGSSAQDAAAAMGVDPSALAGTCVMEVGVKTRRRVREVRRVACFR